MAKLAIITGASRGIGKAVAESLYFKGYDIVICSRKIDDLKKMKHDLKHQKTDGEVYCFAHDLSKQNEAKEFANAILDLKYKPHILVNNVGLYREGDYLLDEMLNINLKAPYTLTKSLLPAMLNNKNGYIFNIGSILCEEVRAEAADYTIAKHAFYAFHKLLVKKTRDTGVHTTIIMPGSVNTSSWDNVKADKDEFVQATDIAKTIIHILGLSKSCLVSEVKITPLNSNY